MDVVESIIDDLKREEGSVKKNGLHIPYKDHLGYETIGWGALIDPRLGGGLTDEEAEFILINRIKTTVEQLKRKVYFWDRLTHQRKKALLNMTYQMGITRFMKFKKMLQALERGDYYEAYEQALDSKWARQTPQRAKRVADLIKNG